MVGINHGGNKMLNDYVYISLVISITIVLSFILFGLSLYISSIQHLSLVFDKIMAFECGFLAFKDSRTKFNISYYLLGILFLIFDLEVIFLLPWAIVIFENPLKFYWLVLVFIFILTLGFCYEWIFGALSLSFIGK